MKATWRRHLLEYHKPARTSRGEMHTHTVFYVCLQDGPRKAYGEAAPLPGLSIDNLALLPAKLDECCAYINDGLPVDALLLHDFPSLHFAFEMAALALRQEVPFTLFDTPFLQGEGIPTNGLVWMDTKEAMLEQAFQKVAAGFDCIKFKVGALDFDEECRMLELFRKQFGAFKASIRLDANGAFAAGDALEKLKELSRFELHSLEQPIKAGQPERMQELCAKSRVPIALDEELIGVDVSANGEALLKQIRPPYIILKPTLLGGFGNAAAWIAHANRIGAGWWATSALESNIGLNAVSQWAATFKPAIQQGLGTGSLYRNNIDSPLKIVKGKLYYDAKGRWDTNTLP